jgi:hypothetical protein
LPSSSALIPMSICTLQLQCLFSHSFTTYEWLNRDCYVQIYIVITSRWTGNISEEKVWVIKQNSQWPVSCELASFAKGENPFCKGEKPRCLAVVSKNGGRPKMSPWKNREKIIFKWHEKPYTTLFQFSWTISLSAILQSCNYTVLPRFNALFTPSTSCQPHVVLWYIFVGSLISGAFEKAVFIFFIVWYN